MLVYCLEKGTRPIIMSFDWKEVSSFNGTGTNYKKKDGHNHKKRTAPTADKVSTSTHVAKSRAFLWPTSQ